MILALTVAAVFAAALVAPPLARRRPALAGWLLAAPGAAGFAWFAAQIPRVAAGETLAVRWPWLPRLGIDLAFHLDALALLFALLVTGIGSLIIVYSGRYMEHEPLRGRFFAFLLAFEGAMLGLVLAADLVLLFVFFELTTLASYLLIGFHHDRREARIAARKALVVTGSGGLALLAGFILVEQITGSFALEAILAAGPAIRASAAYPAILALVLISAFSKSAQVPFHAWLPAAMAGPTPVSAYLHSATMVKAGLFVLARLYPALAGTPAWTGVVTTIGALTMVAAAWVGLRHLDLKQVLAATTIMALGLITMLLGLGGKKALEAALIYLVVHALYKAALFLVAGSVSHEAGSLDISELGGLGRAMPLTAAAAALAAVSMAGLPPLFGFLGKETTYAATMAASGGWWLVLSAVSVIANAALVALAGVLTLRVFAGPRKAPETSVHEAPFALWLGPVVLGLVALGLGVFPATADPLIGAALSDVAGQPMTVHLKLWHGFEAPLFLSIVTVLGGAVLYAGWPRLRTSALVRGLAAVFDDATAAGLERLLSAGARAAHAVTRRLQDGRPRHYVVIVLAVLAGFAGIVLVADAGLRLPDPLWPIDATDALLGALVVAGAVTAALTLGRFMAVLALSASGYGIALLYLQHGAPDLAMTQVAIETLTLVLLVLVLVDIPSLRLPDEERLAPGTGMLALACGAVAAGAVLAVTSLPLDRFISTWYAQHSWPEAHGRNIVNVILVDFRALDTLGEATVLAMAGIGVWALVRLRARAGEPAAGPVREEAGTEPVSGTLSSRILRTAARYLVPLIMLFSVFAMLRGHNEPGGGFVGGLLAGSAIALWSLAAGPQRSGSGREWSPGRLLGSGLGLIAISGAVALWQGQPFLTGIWGKLPLGFGHEVKLGTPLLFDIGVFLVVLGVVMAFVLALEQRGTTAAPRLDPDGTEEG
jgi:multicomponent Na+:H+ antiporter subunit A